jgi:hypothetical protein
MGVTAGDHVPLFRDTADRRTAVTNRLRELEQALAHAP